MPGLPARGTWWGALRMQEKGGSAGKTVNSDLHLQCIGEGAVR